MNRNLPRTMYRTPKGTKRLLKRNRKGQIADNQKWKNVTAADQRQKSAAEIEADARESQKGKDA